MVRYGYDNEPGVKPSAGDVAVFLVAIDDGVALGGGGLRLLGEGAAEIKRMWVRPTARGQGVARALLAALEDEARSRGVTRMKIETGDRQHEALTLYMSKYVSSLCFMIVPPERWSWLGEPLAIDFANTVRRRGSDYTELLASGADLRAWAADEANRVPDPPELAPTRA